MKILPLYHNSRFKILQYHICYLHLLKQSCALHAFVVVSNVCNFLTYLVSCLGTCLSEENSGAASCLFVVYIYSTAFRSLGC